ncbi:MAG: NAD(P)H-dependent oxidoreductase [Myxococcales bacterium]|nr:NAD(P)H-dependent oxidoreductase [Myxococcales bacterium]
MTRLLAISGSLRRASSNTAVLEAAAALAPPGVEVELYRHLGDLPLFDPDEPGCPPAVARLRERLAACDGLLVASPEYMHSVSAALKNALEWLTASGDLMDLPTAALNASNRAHRAYDNLLDVLATMDARLVDGACVTVPLTTNAVTADRVAADEALAGPLRASLAAIAAAIAERPRARDTVAPVATRAPGPCFAATVHDALAMGPPPPGNHAVPVFGHGSLVVEMYAPRDRDLQTPHARDELYVIARGTSLFVEPGGSREVGAGTFLFVPAGRPHRFSRMSPDFATWVCFYGPDGGERP